MKDFLLAALPWLAIGLCLAIFFARNANNEKTDKRENKNVDNFGSEGMSVGMCIGVALGTLFKGGVGVGISAGMLLGLSIGSAIPKNITDGEQKNGKRRS